MTHVKGRKPNYPQAEDLQSVMMTAATLIRNSWRSSSAKKPLNRGFPNAASPPVLAGVVSSSGSGLKLKGKFYAAWSPKSFKQEATEIKPKAAKPPF